MKSDIEISRLCKKKNIKEVAKKIGILEEDLILYGNYKAKIDYKKYHNKNKGKLILVTSINPTPYGEGKTTVSIGLGDALNKINKKTLMVLREPSLGPVFGIKGGATGGGYAQIVPMDDINLHFTGDLHAITSCNNLISAAIDNHLYFGNKLNINPETIVFNRCMDMNDRALRNITIHGKITREESFNITAASEVMSVFCLSHDLMDLKKNLGNILIGYTYEGNEVLVKDLNMEGALATLLKDAIKPNLVQTLENNPVLVHGGPFANIAHGCNSIIATKLGLNLSDYVVTEAGFGSDLGAEKFFDIKCRRASLKPNCVVLVLTLKALKYNANVPKEEILTPSVEKVREGLPNLMAHVENILKYTKNLIVCLNKYDSDTQEEIEVVEEYCHNMKIEFAICDSYLNGGEGSITLANKVVDICNKENDFKLLYEDNLSIKEKIEKVATEIYHAGKVEYTKEVEEKLKRIERYNALPVCIAKTQYSISDDPKKLGYPKDYEVTVKDIKLYRGASFITVLLGDIMTMPGLSRVPNLENIDINDKEEISGLF